MSGLKETLDKVNENHCKIVKRNLPDRLRNIVVKDESENVIRKVKEWCEENNAQPIIMDAHNFVRIIIFKLKDDKNSLCFGFSTDYKGSKKDFVLKYGKNIDFETIVEGVVGQRTYIIATPTIDNSDLDTSLYIDLPKLPEGYFIESYNDIKLSSTLSKKINEKCVIFIDNLFTINEEETQKIIGIFTKEQGYLRSYCNRENIIAFIANEYGDNKMTYYLRNKGYFVNRI